MQTSSSSNKERNIKKSCRRNWLTIRLPAIRMINRTSGSYLSSDTRDRAYASELSRWTGFPAILFASDVDRLTQLCKGRGVQVNGIHIRISTLYRKQHSRWTNHSFDSATIHFRIRRILFTLQSADGIALSLLFRSLYASKNGQWTLPCVWAMSNRSQILLKKIGFVTLNTNH